MKNIDRYFFAFHLAKVFYFLRLQKPFEAMRIVLSDRADELQKATKLTIKRF